ncbi:MAG TPA: bL35 family ribosomal protein [Phycisphaerales bacterium]|nr:bL35 family ribosomal protein [Phycisphaerales bacterium]
MHKNKPHKGLLKRVRITKTGLVKHAKAGFRHLRQGKRRSRLRRLSGDGYISTAETKRFSKMLFMRLRGREQPRTALRRSPTPAERAAKRAEARAAVKGTKPAAPKTTKSTASKPRTKSKAATAE